MQNYGFNTILCRFAVALKSLAFGENDVMHVVAGNMNATFPLAMGVWILGGAFSTGDINLEAKAVANQLYDTKAKILVGSETTLALCQKALECYEGASKPKLLCLGPDLGNQLDLLALEKNANVEDCPTPLIQDPNVATRMIFWTSGTTGNQERRHLSTLIFL